MFKLFKRFHIPKLCMECNSGQHTSWYSSVRSSLKTIRQSLYVGISGGSLEEDVRSNLDVEDVQGTGCLKELGSQCHGEYPYGTLKRNI